jgi:hypothetical protein
MTSASDGTAVLSSGGTQCFLHGVQCTSSEERESRIHPIETAPFCPTSVMLGERANGRMRQKAKADESVNFWTNVVLSLVKQLWDGKLNDELIQATSGIHPQRHVKESPPGRAMTRLLRQKVLKVLETRPADFPRGAGAIRRQLGMTVESCPTARAKDLTKTPRRGDIWPAEVEKISLPPAGTHPSYIGKASEEVHDYLKHYKTRMLRSKEEIDQLRRTHAEEGKSPYVDPAIEKDILALTVRMAKSGMLTAVKRQEMTIGLFTVVKKVGDDGELVLRLVFDQRVPNEYWVAPPWTPLAGPGAFAAIDLSTQESVDWSTWIVQGDIPDCFYRWGVPDELAEWFVVPGVTFQALKAALMEENEWGIIEQLMNGQKEEQLTAVGLRVVGMGWSWSVFLAQSALMGVGEMTGEILMKKYDLPENPITMANALVEGGPPPGPNTQYPFHYEYIDDYGFIQFAPEGLINRRVMADFRDAFKGELIRLGLASHKEQEGQASTILGVEIGGVPPVVRPVPEKRWQAIEVQWELARAGRGLAKVVEAVVALTTWIFMIGRDALCIYQEVYHWIRQNRLCGHLLSIPMEVRRELAAAAAALLLVEQDLTIEWDSIVYLFDASEEGGGVVETKAVMGEIKAEGKWAVRGGWTKFMGDQDFFGHYRPTEEEPEKLVIMISPGQKLASHRLVHMFSGLRRPGDLEWFLVRLGAKVGIRVVVESMDYAYGSEFDLSDDLVIDRLVRVSRRKIYSGGVNGSPCSTWSRVRFLPGGPPPLRTRESPWGIPSNTKDQQRHCDEHSRMWNGSMDVLEAIAASGGLVVNEHPKDPGKDPFPSTWNLAKMKRIERKSRMRRVSFPQCLWGQVGRKDTTLSGNVDELEKFDVYGDGRCRHQTHELLYGTDEKGHFKTRQAQTYPPEFCERLALCFIVSWLAGKGNPFDWEPTEDPDDEAKDEGSVGHCQPEMGERVPCPEVSAVWDPLERWKETARWKWKVEEHNNILEARAGVVSAKIATMRPEQWRQRKLLISDSQVAIGIFAKGRSSRRVLNLVARKKAALAISTGSRFYWRYMRTHRNHADGPSRGYPIGVAPKDSEETTEAVSWKKLPDFFYQKTKG